MSKLSDIFPTYNNKRFVVSGFLLVIVITYSIASMLKNSALSRSQSNPVVIWSTLFVLGYVGVLSIMKFMGYSPNRFEQVMIPAIFISIIYLSLNTFGIEVVEENPPIIITTITGESSFNIDPSETRTISTITTFVTITNSQIPEEAGISDEFRNLIVLASFIILTGVMLFLILRRGKEKLPKILISKEAEYSKKLSQNSRQIMEYYIDASINIENWKGKAPSWISPTGFSNDVVDDPGGLIASYFDALTILYEDARFSKRPITTEDVAEAIELHRQIISIIKSGGPSQ